MPPISMKKVLIAILIVVLLSRLDRISALVKLICQFINDSFEPLRYSPDDARLILVVLVLALLYISIYQLLYKKMKK